MGPGGVNFLLNCFGVFCDCLYISGKVFGSYRFVFRARSVYLCVRLAVRSFVLFFSYRVA